MRRRLPVLLVSVLLVTGLPSRGRAQDAELVPSVETVIEQVRSRLARCDSLWTDMTYVMTSHERKLDFSKGTLKKETTSRYRVYARHGEEREVLEAMWRDGEPVTGKKLQREIEHHEKERRKWAAKWKDDEETRSSRMLEPLLAENAGSYDYTAIALDTVDGIEAWRITVEPREESEDLMRGDVWVETGSYRALAEEYVPAKLPGKLHAFSIRMEYAETDFHCAVPRRFRVAGYGKALIFIKFRFEAEVFFDSVMIDSGLPDSLFELVDR